MAAISAVTNERRANDGSFATIRNARRNLNGKCLIDRDTNDAPHPFSLSWTSYFELIEKHGPLKPLVDIQIRAPYFIHVRLVQNQLVYDREIDVRQTVQQFKKYLHELFHIPLARLRVFFVDELAFSMGLGGPEELKYPRRLLHT